MKAHICDIVIHTVTLPDGKTYSEYAVFTGTFKKRQERMTEYRELKTQTHGKDNVHFDYQTGWQYF